ncbi:outer membrane protein assembly factor BamB family protein [Roseimaritima ulvae]|uniref:PQQ enzyme repeat protein n=1 Tax=Roseimaritima ulvae TaxID=980254 RepID=A0A5B9R1D5_9BACT|nr:PQQ-binding-like beta-propeller repeat protein [Roseimaritima ulvae]QEG43226.1 hypothetical protein UC8_52720 [Roseimaritima ulvae]
MIASARYVALLLIWGTWTWVALSVSAADNDTRVYEITPAQQLSLAQLEQLIASQESAAAVDLAVRIIDEADGRMVAVDVPSRSLAETFLPLSAVVHERLLRSGSGDDSALTAYRQRYDRIAQDQLRIAQQARSSEAIQRWQERYFATSWGDDALLSVADWALQNGQGETAIAALRRIGSFTPQLAASEELPVGAYHDSDIPGGEVGVRWVYAHLLNAEPARAEAWAALVKQRFGEQRLSVAGRAGTVADRLDWLLDQAASWSPRSEAADELFPGGVSLSWVHRLPPLTQLPRELAPPAWRRSDRLQGAHVEPLLADGKVFVHTGREVMAVTVGDGQPWPPGIGQQALFTAAGARKSLWPAARPLDAVPRFSLATQGRWLAGRFGAVSDTDASSVELQAPSQIVVLDLQREGGLQSGYPLTAPSHSRFASAPLLTASRLFVAVEQTDEATTTTRLQAYDLPSGVRLWTSPPIAIARRNREVARAVDVALAIDRRQLVCHLDGVTAAVNLHDGGLRWVVRHAVAELADSPYPRLRRAADKSHAALHLGHGQVLVAGLEVDRLVGLQADTGRLRWATAAGVADDVEFVLGASAEHWVVAGRQLYWLNRHNGVVEATFPGGTTAQSGAAAANPHGVGRGWLAEGYVYWPANDAIMVLDSELGSSPQAETQPRRVRIVGRIPLQPYGLRGGNLAAAYGVLVNLGPDYLSGVVGHAAEPHSSR